jgi:hypothetical protein
MRCRYEDGRLYCIACKEQPDYFEERYIRFSVGSRVV